MILTFYTHMLSLSHSNTHSKPGAGLPPSSPATTTHHRHVLIVLQHHLILIVQIQHRDRIQLRRHAAHFRRHLRLHAVDQRLHHRMIGRIQVVGLRKMTLAVAVERIVAGRRHDPIAPAHIAKVHVQRAPLADLAHHLLAAAVAARRCARLAAGNGVADGALPVPLVVRVGEQEGLMTRPVLRRIVGVVGVGIGVVAVALIGALLALAQRRAATQSDVSLCSRAILPARCNVHEEAVILVRLAEPPFDGRLNVQLDRGVSIGADASRVDEQKDRIAFAANAGLDDVVDEHVVVLVRLLGLMMVFFVRVFAVVQRSPTERQFGGLEEVRLRYVGDIEEEPELVVMLEFLVDCTVCCFIVFYLEMVIDVSVSLICKESDSISISLSVTARNQKKLTLMTVRSYRVRRFRVPPGRRQGHRIGVLVAGHHLLVNLHQFVRYHDAGPIDDVRPPLQAELREQIALVGGQRRRVDCRRWRRRRLIDVVGGGGHVPHVYTGERCCDDGDQHGEHVEPRVHGRAQRCGRQNKTKHQRDVDKWALFKMRSIVHITNEIPMRCVRAPNTPVCNSNINTKQKLFHLFHTAQHNHACTNVRTRLRLLISVEA